MRLEWRATQLAALAILLGLLTPSFPAWAQAIRPSIDQLVEFFDTVVFGAEIDKQMASEVVAKWQGPIRVAVQGQPAPRHLEFLAQHAATLTSLTGIPIEILPPGAGGSNFTAVFVPRANMARVKIVGVPQSLVDKLAAAGGCYFLSWQKPVGTIVGAVTVVNVQREEHLIKHCILEEMTQSMGLPNDTDLIRPSIFSDRDTLVVHSRADMILIRALYDPRLAVGTPRLTALKRVRPIIAEIDASLPSE